jgi:hypothetical protein
MNKKVLSGEMSYRDSFAAMLKSVPLPFPKCAELLRDSELPSSDGRGHRADKQISVLIPDSRTFTFGVKIMVSP